MSEPFELRPWFLVRLVKIVGQRSRSYAKNDVLTSVLTWSRSKARVKVKGRGQGQRSIFWSILGARLCLVQQRAKKSHYQSKAFIVCQITAWMWSIGFLICDNQYDFPGRSHRAPPHLGPERVPSSILQLIVGPSAGSVNSTQNLLPPLP